MTLQEMKRVFKLLQTAYPGAEMFQDDVRERLTLWAEFFAPVPAAVMEKAVSRVIATSKFAPAISELADACKAVLPQAPGASWDDLLDVCERVNDLRQDFGYTYKPEGSSKTQGELARDKVRRMYEALPPVVQEYVGSYAGLLRVAQEIGSADTVGFGILRREYESFTKDAISHSSLAGLLEANKEYYLEG